MARQSGAVVWDAILILSSQEYNIHLCLAYDEHEVLSSF
jgi:hypothetical protein